MKREKSDCDHFFKCCFCCHHLKTKERDKTAGEFKTSSKTTCIYQKHPIVVVEVRVVWTVVDTRLVHFFGFSKALLQGEQEDEDEMKTGFKTGSG